MLDGSSVLPDSARDLGGRRLLGPNGSSFPFVLNLEVVKVEEDAPFIIYLL